MPSGLCGAVRPILYQSFHQKWCKLSVHVVFSGFTLWNRGTTSLSQRHRVTQVSPAGIYDPDQTGSGLLDILRGGTERFLTNIKDTSSKVIQSVARYDTGLNVVKSDRYYSLALNLHCSGLVSFNIAFLLKTSKLNNVIALDSRWWSNGRLASQERHSHLGAVGSQTIMHCSLNVEPYWYNSAIRLWSHLLSMHQSLLTCWEIYRLLVLAMRSGYNGEKPMPVSSLHVDKS